MHILGLENLYSGYNQWSADFEVLYTFPKEIDFPQYNMKCSAGNLILRGLFPVVSCFPLHFMLYSGNFDYFSDIEGKCIL